MENSNKPFEGVTAMISQNMEQASKAMENYLQFVQKSMSSIPWGKNDLSEKVRSYAEKNVAAAFEFAQKLTKAKDLQDLMRVQTEFMQTQLKSLTEQAKELSEAATKFKGISS
ncbi:MAG TPA: TIGR01841 family phasin [Terriglobales bacterium]|nr:TIGR01841 family phasin [Terriglobales bacterium]